MCVLLYYYIVCISICLSCLLKIMQNLPPSHLSLYRRDTVNIPHAIHATYPPIYVCITILLHSMYIYMSVLSIENNAKPATKPPLPI